MNECVYVCIVISLQKACFASRVESTLLGKTLLGIQNMFIKIKEILLKYADNLFHCWRFYLDAVRCTKHRPTHKYKYIDGHEP